MPLTEETYRRVVLEDPDAQWELHRGRLREKPPMTHGHNSLMVRLGLRIGPQLDWDRFELRINAGHVRHGGRSFYVPDVYVLPAEATIPFRGRRDLLEAYDVPLPLVVEIWSPSTGSYDADEKRPDYRARGDTEIWRLHPDETTLRAWRSQSDGSYVESVHTSGTLTPSALPGVKVDLDALFR